ncbi:hypothetical protein ACV2U4_005258, partial [Escherichia coli]
LLIKRNSAFNIIRRRRREAHSVSTSTMLFIYTAYIKETPLVQTRYVHQPPQMILCALLLFITNGSA